MMSDPSSLKKFTIRKARVADVPRIAALVNYYAAQGEMLPKSLNQVYQNIRDFMVADEDGQVVGCGALHVLWEDLGEIRSLAVEFEKRGNGVGRLIVTQLLAEARELGLPTVFALTYRPTFFQKLGFQIVDKEALPRKIWADCIDCLKFPHCNEVAVQIQVNQ